MHMAVQLLEVSHICLAMDSWYFDESGCPYFTETLLSRLGI